MSKGPIDYFLGKNFDREYAQVLDGNLAEVSALIDTSPFEKKYTSGCMSFYEHDLDDSVKKKIMQDFEKTLFPGMDPSQYRVLWIEHKDKMNEETGERRLELNFLIPNVEIPTGKRLQPYYDRADRPRVDLFKKITNHAYGLHDADDPLHRQAVTTAKNLPKAVTKLKETLDIEVTKAIEAGLIKDRETMKKWLVDLGLEITRETKKSISIKNPAGDENARPIRLTGAIYEQDFRLTAESAELTRDASERYRQGAEQRYQANLERYESYCAKRSAELEHQYRQHTPDPQHQAERSNRRDTDRDRAERSTDKKAVSNSDSRLTATATARARALDSELEGIEPIQPRRSAKSEAEKSPFYIEFSPDFTSMYHAHQRHLSRLRQQKQVHRHQSDAEQSRVSEITRREHEYSKMREREKMAVVRTDRPQSTALQQQLRSSTGNQLNDARSTIIADHRRTAEAIERTTASTAESTGFIASAIGDYRAVKDLNEDLGRQTQRSETDYRAVSADRAETIRADYIADFYQECATALGATARDTFSRVGADLRDREQRRSDDTAQFAKDDTERDRRANQAPSKAIERENDLSRAISADLSGFNPKNIFTALDRLEQRKEKQRVRDNDRGFEM